MDNKRKNLEDLEVSINALQKKASLINESIKNNNKFLNKKLIEKENINIHKEDNIPILNKESNISNVTTIEELEIQLKKELARDTCSLPIKVLITARGGHNGFHGPDDNLDKGCWSDRLAITWFEQAFKSSMN